MITSPLWGCGRGGGGDHLQALEPLAAPPDVAVDGRLTEKLPFSEKEATHRLQVKG